MSLTQGSQLRPYRILSQLGKGGMGEGYRAQDARPGRDVAIKVLPDQLTSNSESLRRFEREGKALAALSHPNILTIFDVGNDQELSYVVMELLEGETLRAIDYFKPPFVPAENWIITRMTANTISR